MIIRKGYRTLEKLLKEDIKEVLFNFTIVTEKDKLSSRNILFTRKEFEIIMKHLDSLLKEEAKNDNTID